jgi:hypothetical protein
MVKPSIEELRKSMDEWVREMNSKVEELSEVPKAMVENTDNIQHNYELIAEMKAQLDEMKQDIRLIKLMQLSFIQEHKLKH